MTCSWRSVAYRLVHDDKEASIQWIYLAVIPLLAAATIRFALRSCEIVSMPLPGFNVGVPLITVGCRLDTAVGGLFLPRFPTTHDGLMLN